jgi:phosphatidylserine/phosphatidylglycerophosphate/cardiolipin synthase-like enzyme
MPLLFGADWQEHPNIILKLDRHHPLYAAHHQKLVIIDDRLAFAGGIDLTVCRWDTCGHSEQDQYRVRPDGTPYRPVHDVQMVVDGEAAVSLGDVARQRWLIGTGEALRPVDGAGELWPPDLLSDFSEVDIGIARTIPAWGETQSISEIARLTEDMISAAQHSLYIEAQYLTASNVRELITRTLAAKRGPEIVMLVKKSSPGVLERFVMGANRDRACVAVAAVRNDCRRLSFRNRPSSRHSDAGPGRSCKTRPRMPKTQSREQPHWAGLRDASGRHCHAWRYARR